MKIDMAVPIRYLVFFVCVLGISNYIQAQHTVHGGGRPNIILILADDMGYSDIGPYGGEIHTPSLDRLSSEGIRFTQFYNVGRCCPTRASLLSGLYSHQAGVGHMVDNYAKAAREKLNSASYQDHLSDRCVTIAEALRAGGYQTFMAGKWHLGDSTPPHQRGFDHSYALINGATNYFDPNFYTEGLGKATVALDGKPIDDFPEEFYATDAFTDHALNFLKRASPERPFFLYMAYNAPHWPLNAKPKDIEKYRGKYEAGWDAVREERYAKMKAKGIIKDDWQLTPRDSSVPAWDDLHLREAWPPTIMNHGRYDNAPTWESITSRADWDLKMAIYAAQVHNMDQNIGRLLDYLDASGAKDNTLIIFLSDNGGANERPDRSRPGALLGTRDSYTAYDTPWANVSNTPFRLYKTSQHEGGISTPLIMRWPAVLKSGGVFDHQPGHIIDIMATCLDAAAIQYPVSYKNNQIQKMEGKSLLPALQGRKRELHEIIGWEHQGNKALRHGDWKLVSLYGGRWELYNIAEDRGEMNDLAARHPAKVEKMKSLWQSWADRVGVKPWELTK